MIVGKSIFVVCVGVLATAVDCAVELRGTVETAFHPRHFVVVFRANASMQQKADHMARHQKLMEMDSESEIRHNFAINGFEGYAAHFSEDILRSARMDTDTVEFIEFDGLVTVDAPISHGNVIREPQNVSKGSRGGVGASCSSQSDAIWGLTRIAERDLNLNGYYPYDSDGSGVNAYVLDTGVYTAHSDFGGRASFGASFISGDDSKTDRNGHGTHCAGTIASTTYGVAKGANIIGVQVLSRYGSGSMSGVIKGLEWVCEQESKSENNKCVINLSLSGGQYDAMNLAANQAVACGCTVVVAAGNDGSDACQRSPASASDVVTTGATNKKDNRAYFSNLGSCVDIFAPGVYITSTWIGSQYAINTISGTSMAAPHVAGVAARVMGAMGTDGYATKESITSVASSGYINNPGSGSPNLLLYGGGC